MKKVTLLLSVLLLLFAGTPDSLAQSKEETIANLNTLFSENGIEDIEELSPCRIRMGHQPISDTYVTFSFAPHEATWEGKPYGVYADWTIIEETETYKGTEESFRNFGLYFINDGEELHTEIAALLNHLASFCDLPVKERVLTDQHLIAFIYAIEDIRPQILPKLEELNEQLQGYTTNAETLMANYQKISEGADMESLSAVEQQEFEKTKAYFEDFLVETEAIEDDYLYGNDSMLAKYQYKYIYDKINTDPAVLARVEKLLADW